MKNIYHEQRKIVGNKLICLPDTNAIRPDMCPGLHAEIMKHFYPKRVDNPIWIINVNIRGSKIGGHEKSGKYPNNSQKEYIQEKGEKVR